MFRAILAHAFAGVLHWLLTAAPWLWLGLCAVIALALYVYGPVLFWKCWRTLATVAVVGFAVLWIWQHFTSYADLKKQNTELQQKLDEADDRISNLSMSISAYEIQVNHLEQRQRQIRQEIANARIGLDAATALKEANDDPVKAGSDLSDRYNRLHRMFDNTTSSFGRATSTGTGTGTNPNTSGPVDGH